MLRDRDGGYEKVSGCDTTLIIINTQDPWVSAQDWVLQHPHDGWGDGQRIHDSYQELLPLTCCQGGWGRQEGRNVIRASLSLIL